MFDISISGEKQGKEIYHMGGEKMKAKKL